MRTSVCIALTLLYAQVLSGSTDTMEVHVTVIDTSELSVDIVDIPIIDILSIPDGQLFVSETDSSSTYTYSTNTANKKITAVLDSEMPFLTTLEIALAASAGKGVSTGTQLLSASPVDTVTSIDAGSQETGQVITYTFTVLLGADPFEALGRTVTLSLVDE